MTKQEEIDKELFEATVARNRTPKARKRDRYLERTAVPLRAERLRCRVRSGTPDYEGVL